MGAFLLGSFSSVPAQSSASGTPSAPPGVSYTLAQAQIVSGTSVPATGACTTSNLGNLSSPTALTNGTSTGICLSTAVGGFAAGDVMYILQVSWNHSALNATVFEAQIAVDVTPTSHNIVATSYVKTSATIVSSESAVFAVDLIEAGDTSVTGFSVLITQL